MTWAILGLAVAVVAFAGTSVALGIRAGNLRAERDAADTEKQEAIAALIEEQAIRAKLHRHVLDQGKRLESLRHELETCGDPDARSRMAVDGIRRLLSKDEERDTEADPTRYH